MFHGLSNLRKLELSCNRIQTEITTNLLHHLIKLESLRLNNNRIEVIKANAFEGLHNLREFDK